MNDYDVVVIGAGPAGYVCAIRCAQLGMKAACVDEWVNAKGQSTLGGTCLNVGCIPSKALLESSHHIYFLKQHAREHGINFSNLEVDVSAMQKRKDKVVRMLGVGVASLLKKNKVDIHAGTASFISANKISVRKSATEAPQVLDAEYVVIASGSVPAELPIARVDDQTILDSTGALVLNEVPKRLGIIGAGVIGLEIGSIWARLGAEVVILEALPEFLALADTTIAKEGLKILKQQGLDIRLNSRIKAVHTSEDGGSIQYEVDGEEKSFAVDKLVVAVGRKANTAGLHLENAAIHVDETGFIKTDRYWRTSVEKVYAIGDVIGGAMLAHKGSEEGVAVAERIAGQYAELNHNVIPWVIYTWPEIAWVGKTEQDCKADGINYKVGTFPFMALGRARAMGETQGSFKIIEDQDSDRILGVHILGPNASELISEAVVAIESELSSEDLARTIHAHPSLAEGIHEAALAVYDRALHI